MENKFREGSQDEFTAAWQTRKEADYCHWVQGPPKNQIQLAFQQHFKTFQRLLEYNEVSGKTCCEFGCGRGTLSMYFAEHGWNCSLLDSSSTAINIAKTYFENNDFKGRFVVGDCNHTNFEDNEFDLVFSIGLLEHFDDIDGVLREKLRICKKGGLVLTYIVPDPSRSKCQTEFAFVNRLLTTIFSEKASKTEKQKVYRNCYFPNDYVSASNRVGFSSTEITGAYPLPLLSWNTEFPFTLLPTELEELITQEFEQLLKKRAVADPWLCDWDYGQAYLLISKK